MMFDQLEFLSVPIDILFILKELELGYHGLFNLSSSNLSVDMPLNFTWVEREDMRLKVCRESNNEPSQPTRNPVR
jgi:hypothetical protein